MFTLYDKLQSCKNNTFCQIKIFVTFLFLFSENNLIGERDCNNQKTNFKRYILNVFLQKQQIKKHSLTYITFDSITTYHFINIIITMANKNMHIKPKKSFLIFNFISFNTTKYFMFLYLTHTRFLLINASLK